MPNQNDLPPLPEIPVPESSNVRLSETGEFNFATNLNEIGSVTRNWSISYQRLQSENPNAPTYQLLISSGVGTVGEIVKKIERIIANDNFENILYAPRILTLNHR